MLGMTSCSHSEPHRGEEHYGAIFSQNRLRVLKFVVYLQTEKEHFAMSTQNMIALIADYFKTQPVVKAWLFGSYARGEETAMSDVDLLVEYDHEVGVSLLKHAGMMVDLEKILDRQVDIAENGTLRPRVAESVNRDKKLIYERVC